MRRGTEVMEDALGETLTDRYCGIGMGITAGKLGEKYNISREEQDQFALKAKGGRRGRGKRQTGGRNRAGMKNGKKERDGWMTMNTSDQTTLEKLAKLKPAF